MPIIGSLASLSKNDYSGLNTSGTPVSQYYYYSANQAQFIGTEPTVYDKVFNNTVYQIQTLTGTPYYPSIFKLDGYGNSSLVLPTTANNFNLKDMTYDSLGNLYLVYDTNVIGSNGTFLLQKYDTSNTLVYSKQYTYTSLGVAGVLGGISIDNSNNIYVFNYLTTGSFFCTKINSSTFAIISNISYLPGTGSGINSGFKVVNNYNGYITIA